MDNKPSLLELANAMCGDALKACLINHFYPEMRINPILVRAPKGEVELAAAAERAKNLQDEVATEPEKRAQQLMVAIRQDDAKKTGGMFSGQDIDPVSDIQERLSRQKAYNESKMVVQNMIDDGKYNGSAMEAIVDMALDKMGVNQNIVSYNGVEYITKENAAALLGTGLANIYLIAKRHGWERSHIPGQGKCIFYKYQDVMFVHAERLKKKAA